MGKQLTREMFLDKCVSKYRDRFEYDLTNFVTVTGSRIILKCKHHGDVPVYAKYLLSSTTEGCPRCAQVEAAKVRSKTKIARTTKNFESRCRVVHGDKYDYSKVLYESNMTKVVIVCPVHGEFAQAPAEHWSGSGCKKCGTDRVKKALTKTFKQFEQQARLVHDRKYTYTESTYIGSRSEVSCTCPTHGEFFVTPDNHINKLSGCPKCSSPVSKVEMLVASWFPSSRGSDRDILNGQELDIVFDTEKLAVEINGIYWHSEACGKGRSYHFDKLENAKSAGYRLLQFYDTEIYDTPEIVKSMIMARLGISSRIGARKLEIIDIDDTQARTFCNLNHLQGYAASSARIALAHNNEILAVMTFAKPRFRDDCEFEMIRFCTKLGTTIVGGASKLYSHFLKTYSPKSMVSYANLRYSTGCVYKQLGLTLDSISEPSYTYMKPRSKISRYQAQKHLLPKLLGDRFDPLKSETDNMVAAGYNKVYDCGNAVYIWRKP